MDPNTEYILPFTNAKEFVEWARAAVARKQVVSDQRQVTHRPFVSFYRVKAGSYIIPRTEHRVTKLPQGLL